MTTTAIRHLHEEDFASAPGATGSGSRTLRRGLGKWWFWLGLIRATVMPAGCWLAPSIPAQNSSNVVVAFTSTNATPLTLGYAGFTTELLGTGIEYADTNMQRAAASLSPGWLLYPAGTTGDAFQWSSGLTVQRWVDQIGATGNNTASNLAQGTLKALLGKGGAQFTNFASLAAHLGGAKIIICVNGFTDSSDSAGAFAAFALTNHIQVAAWELCNEPYLFKGPTNFFLNGTDYANKMKPYRDAIKAADSNAVVAVFFSDPALPGTAWDKDLGNYTNKYWDAVVYHHYPRLPTNSTFAALMAMDNGILFSNTTSFVTNHLMTNNNASVKYLITELSSNLGNGDGTQNPPTSTLYGGIYAAEYVMRLSTVPQLSFAGSYQLVNGSGVDTTNRFWNAVSGAAAGGYVTNTVGLPFGYFLSAQGSAEAVAYWALNRSTGVFPTTVGANCPTVPMDTNGLTVMPALYAQAYQGGNGRRYVLLTNKGSNAVPVDLIEDGVELTNQLQATFVTSTDPSVVNANPPLNNVVTQALTTNNPVTLPPYSVMRLEWTVFSVPQPLLSLVPSNSIPTLEWSGPTSVIYQVQSQPNLLGIWTTLGVVLSSQTNSAFADPSPGLDRFYRLLVP